jgi:hypothetical protein
VPQGKRVSRGESIFARREHHPITDNGQLASVRAGDLSTQQGKVNGSKTALASAPRRAGKTIRTKDGWNSAVTRTAGALERIVGNFGDQDRFV